MDGCFFVFVRKWFISREIFRAFFSNYSALLFLVIINIAMSIISKKDEAKKDYKKAKELEKNKQFFSASFYYKNSLKIYRDLGDSKKQKICKKKLIEMNKLAVNEFSEFKFEQNIPKEKLEKEMEELRDLMEGDLGEILDRIGRCTSFTPKIKDIETTANNTMPVSVFIATTVTLDGKGNIIDGSHDGMYAWKMNIYEISQGLISGLYLKTLIDGLISSEKLNPKDLIIQFKNKNLISEGDLEIIRNGIEAYFEKNYVSALHILVPKLESLFLNLSEKLGVDIISLNSGKEISTKTRTLSEFHLDSPAFKKVWGEDLCEQLNFVLFRPLGYKLRHKIAHGEINIDECNCSNASLILFFYITLLFRIKRK
jgi:hypothetical protein